MNTRKNIALIGLALTLGVMAGCSSDDDDDDGSDAMDMDMDMEQDASFNFRTEAPEAYASRIDRSGMPAVATALIQSKDSYNEANPANDVAGDFVPEIIGSLTFLHNALDDQLRGLGFVPCTVVGDGNGTCVAAAGPLIIPDTISIDTNADAGFPNGRLLTDPVIDVTLAVALLELTDLDNGQSATSLVGALNPAANDLEFNSAFPFLADPH